MQIAGPAEQAGTHGVRCDAATVKRDGGLDRENGIGKERNPSAHAESDASKGRFRSPQILAQPSVSGAHIGLEVLILQGAGTGRPARSQKME